MASGGGGVGGGGGGRGAGDGGRLISDVTVTLILQPVENSQDF